MTFKATIKAGTSEVSTAECGDVTLLTPNEHTIVGATAVYAYDRLYDLVGKYCMPGTVRGNGHADDMGRALRAVLDNQLALIASMDRDLATARNERDEARAELARVKEYYNGAPPFPTPATGTAQGLIYGVSKAMKDYLPMAITPVIRTERSSDVPLGTIEVVIREPSGFSSKATTPAVTKDTPVTLGMLREVVGRGQEIRERNGEPSWVGRVSPVQQAIDEKLGAR